MHDIRDYTGDITAYLEEEINVIKSLDAESVNRVLNILEQTRGDRKSVYIFGNGGSSATASHFQNDFNKGLSEHLEPKYDFRCLNDNVATIMAVANDISFEEVFRFQLQGHLHKGDVVIAISGSGNSQNVINGALYAKEQGCKVITLTGFDGGKLKKLADVSLHVPVNSMQITEDIHMIFDHLMMNALYKRMCKSGHIKG